MTQRFSAERAISPTDGSSSYVVIDDAYTFHGESCEYRSGHTQRAENANSEGGTHFLHRRRHYDQCCWPRRNSGLIPCLIRYT